MKDKKDYEVFSIPSAQKRRKNMTENITQIGDMTHTFYLKDMAAYQGHSVVSREIIRKPAGTMTVFAFDQGEGLSEHTAPFDAVVHLLEGGRGELLLRAELKPSRKLISRITRTIPLLLLSASGLD